MCNRLTESLKKAQLLIENNEINGKIAISLPT